MTEKTKIDGVEFSCEQLGVTDGMRLEGRVSSILAGPLSVGGVEISSLFGGGDSDLLDTDIAKGGSIVALLGRFRSEINWDEFTALLVDCCSDCEMYERGIKVPFEVDDLNRKTFQHYKLFFWYLECQLGPFIDLIRPFLMEAVQTPPAKDSSPE